MNCNSNTAPLLKQSVTMSCNNGCTPKDINVICKKIIIPAGQEILGIQGENDTSKRYFLIPKITESGDDLSNAQFNIIVKSNTNGVKTVEIKQTEILENYIKLEWKIDNNITNASGELQVQIEATKDNTIWKTYPATFIIASSLDGKNGDIIHPSPGGATVDKKYVDTQDKNVLRDAEEYADNQDKNVLRDAKEYADAQVPNIVETYIEEHKEELKGKDGTDGFSPSASVTQTETGATVTITDKTGTTTAEIKNGTNGKDGTNGTDGRNGTDGKNYSVEIVESALTTQEIESNKFYKFGEVSSLNITLAAITDTSVLNEFMFEFISGATATTLTLPNTIKWLETPTIEANKIYQCSIVDNIGVLLGVSNV